MDYTEGAEGHGDGGRWLSMEVQDIQDFHGV
jgi:hypothetical protein